MFLLWLLSLSWQSKTRNLVTSRVAFKDTNSISQYVPFSVAWLGSVPDLFLASLDPRFSLWFVLSFSSVLGHGRWTYGGSCLGRIENNSNSRHAGREQCLVCSNQPASSEATPGRGALQSTVSENMECPRPSPRLSFQTRREVLPRGCPCRDGWFLVINQQLRGRYQAVSRASQDNTWREFRKN